LWGAVFSTAPVMNAGANCVWGSTLAPTEGHVVMPMRTTKGSLVAVRVLDYDYGRKDDVLGECLVDVDALLAAPGQMVSLPLFRKQGIMGHYGPQLVHGQPSMVTLCALPESAQAEGVPPEFAQGVRRVRFCLVSATNLRAADWVGSNDVYCKLWEVDAAAVHQGKPLPEPPARATMPQAQRLSFPFTFQLPSNLPSTIENVPGLDWGYIRCSVYAYIDIARRLDPSVRAFVTVVQPVPASLPRLLKPVAAAGSKPMYGVRCGCCCDLCLECWGPGCCENKNDPLGDVALEVGLVRSGMAPGELVPFSHVRVVNGTALPSVLRIQFVRHYDAVAYCEPGTRWRETFYTAYEAPVAGNADVMLTPEVVVPLFAPDYHGWGEAASPYPESFIKWGSRYTSLDDPLRWRTELRVTLDTPDTPFDLNQTLPVFICALPPLGMLGAMAAPAGQYGMSQSSGGADEFSVLVSAEDLRSVDLAQAQTASQKGVFAQDDEEDCKTDTATLTVVPTYFVVASPAPRLLASPYAKEVMVDVSCSPPGSYVVCPQTKQPFMVPYMGMEAVKKGHEVEPDVRFEECE